MTPAWSKMTDRGERQKGGAPAQAPPPSDLTMYSCLFIHFAALTVR
jgi:hypothetical protein